VADVVERWIPRVNVRKDLFGVGDILAAHPRDRVILLVQATTAGHLAHRLAKAKGRPELRAWLQAGGLFQAWGWIRRGQRWLVKIVSVQAEDLRGIVLESPPHRRPSRHRSLDLFDTLEEAPNLR
jgi:hypothetical protein